MKKFTTLLTMAFIALMSISLTSCDDDSDIAYTLDGTWRGNMLVEYDNHNALYSVIRFDQNDGIYSGTGYWIDYFQEGTEKVSIFKDQNGKCLRFITSPSTDRLSKAMLDRKRRVKLRFLRH